MSGAAKKPELTETRMLLIDMDKGSESQSCKTVMTQKIGHRPGVFPEKVATIKYPDKIGIFGCLQTPQTVITAAMNLTKK